MRHLIAAFVLSALALSPAVAADKAAKKSSDGTYILTDKEDGTTFGRVDGEPVMLQKTPDGTVGKMGKDKVILMKDGQGNTIGRVGDKKVFCHKDPEAGLTFCK
ncbi:hypothetical protein [Magnetospirillum moscoviense]|uniref:Uncharacterized protein n=1 Tax=Magnetospirillum moscoviense TaxID=1437059 RepID=A0A178MBV1_9PROT|nr:hypothetical protein [Magnetospirillum moscoviense]OAN45344.1 hypothetical protein A6A05_04275 [Magnetospirillum moscoviense]